MFDTVFWLQNLTEVFQLEAWKNQNQKNGECVTKEHSVNVYEKGQWNFSAKLLFVVFFLVKITYPWVFKIVYPVIIIYSLFYGGLGAVQIVFHSKCGSKSNRLIWRVKKQCNCIS